MPDYASFPPPFMSTTIPYADPFLYEAGNPEAADPLMLQAELTALRDAVRTLADHAGYRVKIAVVQGPVYNVTITKKVPRRATTRKKKTAKVGTAKKKRIKH